MEGGTLTFIKDLRRLKYILICTGLNLEPSKSSRYGRMKNRFVFIFNFIWLNSDIIGAIFWIMDCVKNGADMTEITYLAPCATLSGVASIKSIYLIFYGKNVEGLIAELDILEREAINNKIAIKDKIEKEERKFLNFVINLLNVLNIGMVVNFTFGPLILILIKYVRTKEVELILPFLDVYPFDPLDIRYWPLVYIKQIWSECIVLLEICAADYFYYICCTNIRIQFRLLAHEFEMLVPDDSNCGRSGNDTLREKLMKLTKWHQRLINTTNTLEIIYSKSTLFNFVSSSIIICLTGFNVTAINNVAFAVTFLTFLSMSLLQIFCLCLFGDMIMRSERLASEQIVHLMLSDPVAHGHTQHLKSCVCVDSLGYWIKQSLEVSDAVYNSSWYAADTRTGKDLLLIQIRAQKPCKLTALGFADVNLRAFTKIISSAWSYFALLNTMYNSDQE